MPTTLPMLIWWLFGGSIAVVVFLAIRMISKQDAEIKDILLQIRDILAQRLLDQKEYNEFARAMMQLKGAHDERMKRASESSHARRHDDR
jgi:hypothetical protein